MALCHTKVLILTLRRLKYWCRPATTPIHIRWRLLKSNAFFTNTWNNNSESDCTLYGKWDIRLIGSNNGVMGSGGDLLFQSARPFPAHGGAIIYPVVCIAIFFAIRPFRKAMLIFFAVFAAVLVWWLLIPASNNRDWQPDVALLPSAVIDGDTLTVRNIRNCDYRTKTEYMVSCYDKTFDLSKLQGADLL